MQIMKLFGPPGTGKTSALLEILENELRSGVEPEKVAFMSFTVAARKEAVARAMSTFDFDRSQLMHFRTVHSAAFRQVGAPRSAIVTPDKIAYFSEVSNIPFTAASVANEDADSPMTSMMSSSVEGDRMMAFDHLRRHRLQSVAEALIDWEERPILLEHFVKSYEAWKEREGLYDFTDLLSQPLVPLDIEVVFIDEAQDLSQLQWDTVWRLCANAERMYIAGDDDQAIFEWAGADPQTFVDLKADDVRILGQSYRVPGRVHDVARHVVRRIRRRQPKEWKSRGETGHVRWETSPEFWEPVADDSTFVLARNKRYLRQYEDHLRELGYPYHRLDHTESTTDRWSASIVLWEKQRRGQELTEEEQGQVQRALMPGSNIDRSVPWFDALSRISERDRLFLRAILRRFGNRGLIDPPKIALSTIHGVKGREADHVVMDTGMSPVCVRKLHDDDPDSEARVTYVGVTRAKKSFTLVGDHHPLIPVNLLGRR